jgi:hypothetical protein
MSESLTYQRQGASTRDQVHTLFARSMGYVAATAGLFALGAYLDRNMVGVAWTGDFARENAAARSEAAT